MSDIRPVTPTVIVSVEDLTDLPVGTVVLGGDGIAAQIQLDHATRGHTRLAWVNGRQCATRFAAQHLPVTVIARAPMSATDHPEEGTATTSNDRPTEPAKEAEPRCAGCGRVVPLPRRSSDEFRESGMCLTCLWGPPPGRPDRDAIADLILIWFYYEGREGPTLVSEDRDSEWYMHAQRAAGKVLDLIEGGVQA